MRNLFFGAAIAAAFAVAGPAQAQDGSGQRFEPHEADPQDAALPEVQVPEGEPAVSVSFNAGLVSDYRFRGISQSDLDPAVQGGVDISGRGGWFAGAWASTVDEDYIGAETEFDLYGGYATTAGGIDLTFTALAYLYPGGSDLDSYELQAEAAHTIGPARLSTLVAYSPDQENLGTDNIYVGGGFDVGVPQTPITLRARLGYENGSYDNKIDWEIGADYVTGPLTLSLAYVDTDQSEEEEEGRWAKAGLLASIRADF